MEATHTAEVLELQEMEGTVDPDDYTSGLSCQVVMTWATLDVIRNGNDKRFYLDPNVVMQLMSTGVQMIMFARCLVIFD